MNVFGLRNRLVQEYRDFVESFLTIRDKRIKQTVDEALGEGLLWPEALVHLNPGFEMPADIDGLVDRGLLHPECRRIFRKDKSEEDSVGKPLKLYRHQLEAIEAARRGDSYVLTSGTGSGKSLAYLIPIVDAILREGPGKGIRAIVVYPMNALANSQAGELHKFLEVGFPGSQGPVRFCRYTGQESDEERQRIVANPPDILLTNYVMLELILTRPFEQALVRAARNLRFLVLDELHTYRGRQGADVALLVRRVREACEAPSVQCVGTSATLAGVDDLNKQRQRIAEVAALMFGTPVRPENVILETLRRVTQPCDVSDPTFIGELRRSIEAGSVPNADVELRAHPLARWLEDKLGIDQRDGQSSRAKPRPVRGADGLAAELADLTKLDPERCAFAIEAVLSAGFQVRDPETWLPMFAFRVHQFFTRGDTVYASLERPETRHLTLREQQFVPGDRSKLLFPLAFCRECGQEYYSVADPAPWDKGDKGALSGKETQGGFEPRDPRSREDDAAYLYFPADERLDAYLERIPDSWRDPSSGHVLKGKNGQLPRSVRVGPDGRPSPDGHEVLVIRSPFQFCLRCGVSYEGKEQQDYARLATIGEGGRASATTILVAEALRGLKDAGDLPQEARKVLSFTDNRQDASLQAGHFNDFTQVGLLRSALYSAVRNAGEDGLRHDYLTQRVFEALGLPFGDYAQDPTVKFAAREETERTLRDVLGYRLYRDLERGWRITAPNLEQCGLLRFEYLSLSDLCSTEDEWQGLHPVLAKADPLDRAKVARALLDLLRRELAISVDYLEPEYQERLRLRSSSRLASPWAIDDDETLKSASIAYPGPRRNVHVNDWRHKFISARSLFGQYLSRPNIFSNNPEKLGKEATGQIIKDLFSALRRAGLVTVADTSDETTPGYRLVAASMVWLAGDGSSPQRDPLRVTIRDETANAANKYFVDLYKSVADKMVGFRAGEHTAQVQSKVREEREREFREGRLPVLFCSPTMELGVDIAELNVVNLRNVPPTPANYAQRSGRAGRRGQPALVFTYCSATSSHDQYFFRHQVEMVAGQVRPPQLELANEDLIRAHVHAVWLAETGQSLGSSMADVLNLSGQDPSLELRPSLKAALERPEAREGARKRCANILRTVPGLEEADWYHDGWLDEVLGKAVATFDASCYRWRTLYWSALNTRQEQNRIIGDASRSSQDRTRATRLRAEAESQLELLRADSAGTRAYLSDFYSYRYFAGEGFLPGYNFPRLPLSAFIPGRRGRKGQDDFLSRPRFLAIEEFGPRGIVYHEGARYVIHRVLLPSSRTLDGKLVTNSAKQCSKCGYLHLITDPPGPDLCERCTSQLGAPIVDLFRMENVSTLRRDRITSDEEERVRIGYDVQTGIRFAEEAGVTRVRMAEVRKGDRRLAKLTYSSAATLWRINLGWRRRKSSAGPGFWIDPERGTWERRDDESSNDEADQARPRQKVVPYVEDRRNALLFEPEEQLDEATMASLAAALKQAIQVVFQLEEVELAVEPLPRRDRRRLLLFYEAAEGGAGVLRRLVTDPDDIGRVARTALRVCHFDPEVGTDLKRAPRATEDCEAACYDCLMSYTNQPDHKLLDRQLVRDLLLSLASAHCEPSPVGTPRHEHLQMLLKVCQSDLERSWLRFVDGLGLALPSRAQLYVEGANARPDFVYDDSLTAVFVDGPAHEYPDVATRDKQAEHRLEDHGWTVVRFDRKSETWQGVIAQWPGVFGKISP